MKKKRKKQLAKFKAAELVEQLEDEGYEVLPPNRPVGFVWVECKDKKRPK